MNIQKGRVDRLVDAVATGKHWTAPTHLYSALQRQDVWPLIVEQETRWWLAKRAPDFVLMDSYSELTDQFFVGQFMDTGFCANYGDVDHVLAEDLGISSQGLLPIESLAFYYERFFSLVHSLWPTIPIFFIHFPDQLETRDRFIRRAEAIRTAIANLEQSDPHLTSISLQRHAPTFGSPNEAGDLFPYHYDNATYTELARTLAALLPRRGTLA